MHALWTAHIQLIHEDFHRNRVGGRGELFICHMHACHKGIHLECLHAQRTRTVDRQEREDILDSEVNWRCADCVSSDKFRPSAILEEFSQIHGKGRMFLIRWSGYEMAEDSLTHKDHLETDCTGLQAQLTRRRTERSRRRQDRYGKSVLACKFAPIGVKFEGWAHSDWTQFKEDGRRGQKMTKLITNCV